MGTRTVYLFSLNLLVLLTVTSVPKCKAQEISCDNMQITVDLRDEHFFVAVSPMNCAFVYIVIHYVDCVEVDRRNLPQPINETTFRRHPNSRNRIAVQLLPGTGEVVAFTDFVDGIVESSAVDHLRFNKEEDRFEWEGPTHFENCELQYKINFNNEIRNEDYITSETYFNIPLDSCVRNLITVTTIIKELNQLPGEPVSETQDISLRGNRAVQDISFSEENGRFEWLPPDDSERCKMEYRIRFSNAIDFEDVHDTTDPFFAIPLHPCTNNHITVTTVVGFDNSNGEEASASHTIHLDAANSKVQYLRFNEENDRFEWVAPHDSSRCDIQYRIRFSNGIDPENTEVVKDLFYEIPVHSCSVNDITVTAMIGFDNSIGEDVSTSQQISLANSAVRELQFNKEYERFEWLAPQDSSRCNIRYRIWFRNEIDQDTVEGTTDLFYAFHLHSCSNNYITVTTLIGFDDSEGDYVSKSHTISLDNSAVRNLQFNEDKNKFEWEAPEDSDRCELEYAIVYYRNGMFANEVVTTDLFYQIPFYFCSTNFLTVSTIIRFDDTYGEDVYGYHHISSPPVREVRDIGFDESLSRFYWSAPEKSELCKLEYEVEFINDVHEEIHSIRTPNEYLEIVVYPCSNNRINVITFVGYDATTSEIVSAQHAGPVTRQLPLHIRTNPQPTSAMVTWEIERELFNLCKVDYLRYEVTHIDTADETEFSADFQEGTKVDYVLINLEVNQLYSYRLCFIFAAPDSAVCSDSVTFLTQALSKPQITTVIDNDDNIEVSWKQTYYSKFISGHTVIIEPIEPNHFVPSHCVFDKSPTERNLEADVSSYTLEYFLPSFRYNIKVITHFEGLGMTTEGVDEITTKETTPDELDVQYSYKYLTTGRYDVSLAINWSIPCNVNGKVQKFSYVVFKEFYNNRDAKCNDLVKSGAITVTEDAQETYDLPLIPNILPFFRYSVEVTTYLERHDTNTVIELKTPPQPQTPLR